MVLYTTYSRVGIYCFLITIQLLKNFAVDVLCWRHPERSEGSHFEVLCFDQNPNFGAKKNISILNVDNVQSLGLEPGPL